MTIEILSNENFQEASEAMSTAFLPCQEGPGDPISHLLLVEYKDWYKLINQWRPSFVDSGIGYICRDIDGKCLGGVCCKDYAVVRPKDSDLDPKWNAFFSLIEKAEDCVSFKPSEEAPRKKVLHIFLGSILASIRGGGHYKRAVTACVLQALSQGYTHYVAGMGSTYCQKLFKGPCPHHLKNTLEYKTFEFEGTFPFADHESGHKGLSVFYGPISEWISAVGLNFPIFKIPSNDANVASKIEASIFSSHQKKFPVSWGLYQEYRKMMPGGNTKSICWTKPYPLPILRGQGSKVITHENEQLYDFICAYGSIVHGHCHPLIDAAVNDSIKNGILYSLPTQSQSTLANMMMQRWPSLQGGIRFVGTGSEAVMFSLRLSRMFTQRDKFMMFRGAYHGSYDLVMAFDSRGSNSLVMKSKGIPLQMCKDNVLIGEFNDVEGVRELIRKNAQDLACILVEPFLGAAGCVEATQSFMDMIFEEARKANILTLFDEITSARSAYGGMQEKYGVKPDLTAFGKLFGGGHPLGGYGGRKDIMELLDPEKTDSPMLSSGSFFGHDVALRAGIATVRLYDRPTVDEMVRKMGLLVSKLRIIVEKVGIKIQILHTGAVSYIHFTDGKKITCGSDCLHDVFALSLLTFQALLIRNILVTPRLMIFISTVTPEEELDIFALNFEEVLKEIKPLIEERYPQLIVKN